jgi:hypothetical protein
MTSAVNCYFTPERYARTVEIRESPVLAIEEDIRPLFVEAGFRPEFIFMSYEANSGHRLHINNILVVLSQC